MAVTGIHTEEKKSAVARIQSIDVLRGIVMVLMVLDHARTFLHTGFIEFNAEDLGRTTPVLFFTRWVTHFCAPVFIFLAGTGAYLMLQKIQSKKKVFHFLVTRGLLLLLLELTIFRLCWSKGAYFEPYIFLPVIWAIGISMIFLAFITWFPFRIILAFGIAVLLLHNLLGNVVFPPGSAMETFWAFFYKGGGGTLFGKIGVWFLYPVFTYFGLISLGYCLGAVYRPGFAAKKRKRILVYLGAGAVFLFILLRAINGYGDPRPWEPQQNIVFSIMDFLKTTKYPVSLLFALMTIGPALLLLRYIEPVNNRLTRFFATIGSVPLFYYLLHLPLLIFMGIIFGFNQYRLPVVYLFFVLAVTVLYILSRWYTKYKFSHPEKKWLKYL